MAAAKPRRSGPRVSLTMVSTASALTQSPSLAPAGEMRYP